jgi:hypothetical protein
MKRYLTTTLLLCLILPSLAKADITSNLIDHWTFDDCSGTSATDSVGGNTANFTGSPSWTTGNIGACAITWSGTGQYGVTASTISLPGQFTVSAWIKPNGTQVAFFRVVEQLFSNAFSINGTSAATSYQFIMNNGPSGIGGTVTSSWTMVTAVFTTVPNLYINGSFVGAGSASTSGFNKLLYFATYAGSPGSNLFKGDMDDVCIYTRALSAQDVTDLYNSSTGCSAPTSTVSTFKSLRNFAGKVIKIFQGQVLRIQ